MATVRRTLAEHAGGECVFWYEHDDATLRVTAVGCDNRTAQSAYAEAYRADDGSRKQASVFLGGTNTSIAVPTTVALRLQLFVNARGRLDGITFVTAWPALI